MNPTVDTRVGRLQKNQGRQISSEEDCNYLESKLIKKNVSQKRNVSATIGGEESTPTSMAMPINKLYSYLNNR
uniref:Uncharacterized protein n=1 Tax=Arion vulgaris TaxID=1028688 RepID=A0A0B7AEN9_9EUPU